MGALLETQTLICHKIVIKELKLEKFYFQKYTPSERHDYIEGHKVEMITYT